VVAVSFLIKNLWGVNYTIIPNKQQILLQKDF
jgi:hypothetical protein